MSNTHLFLILQFVSTVVASRESWNGKQSDSISYDITVAGNIFWAHRLSSHSNTLIQLQREKVRRLCEDGGTIMRMSLWCKLSLPLAVLLLVSSSRSLVMCLWVKVKAQPDEEVWKLYPWRLTSVWLTRQPLTGFPASSFSLKYSRKCKTTVHF